MTTLDFYELHCFRCGRLSAVVAEDIDDVSRVCPECREVGLYTLVEALDMLNDLFLKRLFKPNDSSVQENDEELDIDQEE